MSNSSLVQFLNQYDTEVIIPSTGDKINIRPITTGQMKKLLAYTNVKDQFVVENILDDILKGCIIDKTFNIDPLTLQDRFEVLLNIRKITKGSDYVFHTKCVECGTEIINNIKLDDLEVVPYPSEIDNKIKLTSSISVDLNYITRGMQKEAIQLVNKLKKMNDDQKLVEYATILYALSMSKFDTPVGEITDAKISDKKELLDNLNEGEYENINNWYKKYDYGVKFKYKPNCSSCNYDAKENDIPLSSFFF